MNTNASVLLERVRNQSPLVHHITNWVTIYDCANMVKVFGGSPVMAHAAEEAAEMAGIASALVLNIGTLTSDLVEAMKLAAKSANNKGIPVVFDVCGAGATRFRDDACFQLLEEARIDIVKGNASEIARIAGEKVQTRGVDATEVGMSLTEIASDLASERRLTVVITGAEDIVADQKRRLIVKNGHPMMASIVGTGCMATSVIGTFAAVGNDMVTASASGLICYEIAAELAAKGANGPASFKERMFDAAFNLDSDTINRMQRVEE